MPKTPIISLSHHHQKRSTSCLPACVVMVLAHWQVRVDEADVRRVLKTRPFSGTHAINLVRLSELGFNAWPIEGTVAELQRKVSEGAPVIAFLWTGALPYLENLGEVDYFHTVVVVGWTDTTVWMHDPLLYDGPTELSWPEFSEAWNYTRQMMAFIEPH
ncbi:MAG: C39 family peptidase [Chloroflexi bacterium]|nr:C39 family peptidase [Chloroflexota bacterium]